MLLYVLVHKDWAQNYDPERTSYTVYILPVTSFSTNYNKTHKSRIEYCMK